MRKIHTVQKRKWGLSTHKNWYSLFHNVIPKRIRPKTFRTEESAHGWAARNGLRQEEYCLRRVKHNKKFEVVKLNGKNKNTADKENNL